MLFKFHVISLLLFSNHALKSKFSVSYLKKNSNNIQSRATLYDRLDYLEYADSTQIKQHVLPIKSSWSNSNHNFLKRQILLVALPSLAACIVEPALTMVDMYFIGTQSNLIAATRGLAGLSVTGSLFNVIAAFTYPLCSGTTAIIARLGNQHQDNIETSLKQKSSILINGYVLSTIVGILFALLVSQYSSFIMKYIFNLDDSLLDLTASYLKIRSLSLPFTLLSYVSIGFCLAIQDVSTPILSIITSSFINILGDYILVSKLGYGLLGASIATAIATITSCLVSIYRIFDKYIHYDHTICMFDNLKVWYSYLDINLMKNFFQTSIPLLIGMVADTLTYSSGAKISSYIQNTSPTSAISHYHSYQTTTTTASIIASAIFTSSSSIASVTTANVATHQIAMQLWWFLSYFSSPVSFAAQAILPKYYNTNNDITTTYDNNNKENQLLAKKTIEKVIQIGGYVGLTCTSILLLR